MAKSKLFFSFEGIDGSGKSTLTRRVANKLNELGHKTLVVDKTLEPENPIHKRRSKLLSKLLWTDTDPSEISAQSDTHLALLAASWYAHIETAVIDEAQQDGAIILADGWKYKILARFANKDLQVETLCRSALSEISDTSMSIFLSISPRSAAGRKDHFSQSETGRLDGYFGDQKDDFISYQSRVLAEYQALIQEYGWIVLDAETNVDALTEMAVELIVERYETEKFGPHIP